MNTMKIAKFNHLFSLGVIAIVMQGCESGSFGSEVGDTQANTAPLSEPQILNGTEGGNEFRTGAEVLMTGKGSEDPDGPIISFSWRHVPAGGEDPIQLIERNSSTVSFTVPKVADGTQLTFDLTVEDADGETATSSIGVVVRNVPDADRFLSLSVADSLADPNVFEVRPVLARSIPSENPDPAPGYSIGVSAYLIYPRTGSGLSCRDALELSLPTVDEVNQRFMTNETDCLVELQQDLTSTNAIDGEFPLDTPPADSNQPTHTLRIPRLDVDDFNHHIIDDNRRADMLELFNVPNAYTVLRARFTPADKANLGEGQIVVAGNAVVEKGSYDNISEFLDVWVTLDKVVADLSQSELVQTAPEYYRRVDLFEERLTLNRWMCLAGFAEDLECGPVLAEDPNDPEFRLSTAVSIKPDAESGTNSGTDIFAHSTYLNNYDLGFGRDMYVRVDSTTGYVYSFVNNYATLEGAIRKIDPVVSVVMEFTPPQSVKGAFNTAELPFVKFFTFAPDGSGDMLRVNSMNFDGRGELPTPGNCVVCHGGNDPSDPGMVGADGNVQATFLSWDPDALLFLDDDPAIEHAPLSLDGTSLLEELRSFATDRGRSLDKATQMTQIKKFNEAALMTYLRPPLVDPPETKAAVRLLDLQYGGHDVSFDGTTYSAGLTGSFPSPTDDRPVPGEWDDDPPNDSDVPAGSRDFYVNVYAQHCRMCHTNNSDSDLRFDEYGKFVAFDEDILASVYERGVMPGARLTTDRFWTDDGSGMSPGNRMAEYLGAAFGLGTPTPPTATAVIDIDPAPSQTNSPPDDSAIKIGTPVGLDGSESLFADTYSWTVTKSVGGVDSLVAVVGTSALNASFVVDGPGDFTVDLSINGGADTASQMFTVYNIPPVANDDPPYTLDLTGCPTPADLACRTLNISPNSVLGNDTDPDGDDMALQVVLFTAPPDCDPPTNGSVQFSQAVTGAFTYVLNDTVDVTDPPGGDSFCYQIADEVTGSNQGTDEAKVAIIFIGPDIIPPTQPTGFVATLGVNSISEIRLDWGPSTDAEGVFGYTVYDVVSGNVQIATGRFITVADYEMNNMGWLITTGLVQNTDYSFAVTATDINGNESDRMSAPQVSLTTNVSYSQAINPIWSLQACTGCHSGTPPDGGLDLSSASSETNFLCLTGSGMCTTGTQRSRVSFPPGIANVEDALILCITSERWNVNPPAVPPQTGCGRVVNTHVNLFRFDLLNNNNNLVEQTRDIGHYNLIRLWLEQGANNN